MCFTAETLTCKGTWTGEIEVPFQPFENNNFEENPPITDEEVPTTATTIKSVNFLVGILEEPFLNRVNDKIRCFIYENTPNGGFRVAQSSDASCRGLVNVRKDGYRTMHLKPGHFCLTTYFVNSLRELAFALGFG
jgi:hypothetical protein